LLILSFLPTLVFIAGPQGYSSYAVSDIGISISFVHPVRLSVHQSIRQKHSGIVSLKISQNR